MFAKRAYFRPAENLGRFFYKILFPSKVKQNLGKILSKIKIFVQDFVGIPVFMVTKSCTKILIFSTTFSCQHFAVEDFVTLFMGRASCRWGNVVFGHGSDKLV